MDLPGAIKSGLSIIANWALPVTEAATAIGVLSMAILQTIKDMFPLRRAFQRGWIQRWLKDSSDNPPAGSNFTASPKTAETQLIRLATDGDAAAFYDLPIEQLCGQMNAALQIVLDDPARNQDLLWCLAHQADATDLARLLAPPSKDVLATPREKLAPPQLDTIDNFVDARNRVGHQAQRATDGLQIAAGFRWKFLLQMASLVVSAILAMVALYIGNRALALTTSIWVGLLTGIAAGFLAPVSRDLVAALQQLRK